MKNLSAILGLTIWAVAAHAAPPPSDLIASAYFAGPQKISAYSQSSEFTNEFCSAEALALRAQTAEKLSHWLSGWLQSSLKTSVPDGPAKLRPLLDDLQHAECLLEIRAAADGQIEAAVAIKLDAAGAQRWEADLKPFFTSATFKTSAGWMVFDSDPALLGLGQSLAKKTLTPHLNWFELDVNWPRLAQWHPALKELTLPETHLSLTAQGNKLNLFGEFHFPTNLSIKLDPWRIPTNTISQPFNSFTAARGFASWYQAQKWAQSYQLSPSPNQLFVWSMPGMAFQTYAAVSVPDAPAAFAQVVSEAEKAVKAGVTDGNLMPTVKPEKNNNEFSVVGVPFMSLRSRPVQEPAGQFLFAELFPNPTSNTPFPQTLIDRLGTENLVFYHWEDTSSRIPQLLQITQLGLLVTQHKQLDGHSVAYKWLRKAGDTPGSTETGIRQTGPAEFTFLRQGPGLFTGMELFALANWLENPNFPGFTLTAASPMPGMTTPAGSH